AVTGGTLVRHQRALPSLVEITGASLPVASGELGDAVNNLQPCARWATIRPNQQPPARDAALSTSCPDTNDEPALIAAAQRDAAAFAPLYGRYVDQIYRFAYRRVGNHVDAE